MIVQRIMGGLVKAVAIATGNFFQENLREGPQVVAQGRFIIMAL